MWVGRKFCFQLEWKGVYTALERAMGCNQLRRNTAVESSREADMDLYNAGYRMVTNLDSELGKVSVDKRASDATVMSVYGGWMKQS